MRLLLQIHLVFSEKCASLSVNFIADSSFFKAAHTPEKPKLQFLARNGNQCRSYSFRCSKGGFLQRNINTI